MFLGFIVFIGVILFVFYLPGRFLLRKFGLVRDNFSVIAALSLSVGICTFLLAIYSLSWLHLEFLYIGCILLLSIFEIKKSFVEIKQVGNKRKHFLPEFIVLILGSFLMAYLTGRSGLENAGELSFYGINHIDSIFNISIIGNLTNNFPPTHPGLSDIPLRGYHFFYYLILSYFVKYFQFNVFDLYFRFFPLFISFFYGLTGIALSRFLKFNRFTSLIFLYLLYFAQGSELLLAMNFPDVFKKYNSGIVQSLSHILNPSLVLSVSLFFSVYILLFNKSKKTSIIFVPIILGILPQIKIYTAIIAFAGLGTVTLYELIKNKNTYFLKILVLASIIASFVYLPTNFGAGGLVFAPLLLYRHFMETPQNFSMYQWGLKYQYYEAYNNFFGLSKLYVLALLFFYLPSLGIRVISIKMLPSLFKKNNYNVQNIFLFSSVFFAFFFASFFVQTSGVFNTIQFIWVSYILLLIPTAIAFASIAGKMMIYRIVIVILLVTVTLPGVYKVLESYSENPYIIDRGLRVVSEKIRYSVEQRDGILVLTRNFYLSPIVSSLTFHPVFYETEVASFNTVSSVINERKKIVAYLDNLLSSCEGNMIDKKLVQVTKKTKNKYILALDKYNCFKRLSSFKLLVGDGKYSLYAIRER